MGVLYNQKGNTTHYNFYFFPCLIAFTRAFSKELVVWHITWYDRAHFCVLVGGGGVTHPFAPLIFEDLAEIRVVLELITIHHSSLSQESQCYHLIGPPCVPPVSLFYPTVAPWQEDYALILNPSLFFRRCPKRRWKSACQSLHRNAENFNLRGILIKCLVVE